MNEKVSRNSYKGKLIVKAIEKYSIEDLIIFSYTCCPFCVECDDLINAPDTIYENMTMCMICIELFPKISKICFENHHNDDELFDNREEIIFELEAMLSD